MEKSYREKVGTSYSIHTTVFRLATSTFNKFLFFFSVINYTFVHGLLMLPKDPLGPNGPTLDEMLRYQWTNVWLQRRTRKKNTMKIRFSWNTVCEIHLLRGRSLKGVKAEIRILNIILFIYLFRIVIFSCSNYIVLVYLPLIKVSFFPPIFLH